MRLLDLAATAPLLCLTFPAFLSVANGQSEEREAQTVSATRDIVYLHSDRPVFIRLQIEFDGESFDSRWQKHIDQVFRSVDRDSNGQLSEEEAKWTPELARAARTREAAAILRHRDLWTADSNPLDGQLSPQELRSFLVGLQLGPFQATDEETSGSPGARQANTTSAGVVLFDLLDRNDDRTISEKEFAQAATSLRRTDLDDDGTIALSELTPDRTNFRRAQATQPGADARPFFVLLPRAPRVEVLRQLTRRYGDASNRIRESGQRAIIQDLSRSQLGMTAETFNQFDADRDGELDSDEQRYLLGNPTPTLELRIRLGKRPEKAEIVEATGGTGEESIRIRRGGNGLVSVAIDDVQIEIGEALAGGQVARNYLLSRFKAADRDNNGYIDEKEADRFPEFTQSFAEFDRDSDGNVFEEELIAAIDSRTQAARSRTRLSIQNRGRDLFEILDRDRNGRLRRQELITAASRIELWDIDGDGGVSEAEVPQLYQVSLGPGEPFFRGLQLPGRSRSASPNQASAPAAPRWFQRLDRNNDGELSRREFPGSLAGFRKMDINGDGVVDPAEAASVRK